MPCDNNGISNGIMHDAVFFLGGGEHSVPIFFCGLHLQVWSLTILASVSPPKIKTGNNVFEMEHPQDRISILTPW